MREIKFRAWDKENNKFFKPTYESYKGKLEDLNIKLSGQLLMRNMSNTLIHESLFPQRFLLQQYTGLKDENGVDIYEGDIVTSFSYGGNHKRIVKFGEYEQDGSGGEYRPSKCMGFYSENVKGQFDDEEDQLIYDFDLKTSLLELNDLEVIGNIYENPELLEG